MNDEQEDQIIKREIKIKVEKSEQNRIPKSNFIEPCNIGILFNDRLSFKKGFLMVDSFLIFLFKIFYQKCE